MKKLFYKNCLYADYSQLTYATPLCPYFCSILPFLNSTFYYFYFDYLIFYAICFVGIDDIKKFNFRNVIRIECQKIRKQVSDERNMEANKGLSVVTGE